MKRFLLLTLFLLLILPVYGASWLEISNKTYIDIDSISNYIDDNDGIHLRQKIYWRKILNDGSNLFKNFEKEHNKKVWYIMTQEIINIDKKTICSKTIIFYDLKEKVLDSFTIPDCMMSWESIVPDTLGETLYNAITEKKSFLRMLYEHQNSNN